MQVFKAFSSDSKIQIIELLLKGHNDCSNSISKKINLDPSTVSRHLKELRDAKLILMQKKGKKINCIVLNKKKIKLLLNTAKELEKEVKK